jgi:hypothetical protein
MIIREASSLSAVLARRIYWDDIHLTSEGSLFRRKVEMIDASITPRYLSGDPEVGRRYKCN